jgi:hypothetical protein
MIVNCNLLDTRGVRGDLIILYIAAATSTTNSQTSTAIDKKETPLSFTLNQIFEIFLNCDEIKNTTVSEYVTF